MKYANCRRLWLTAAATLACAAWLATSPISRADRGDDRGHRSRCSQLPGHAALESALEAAVATETSGFDLDMWATIVDRDGVVCAVAFSGADRGAQFPASRVISAQKANTANAFSLDGLALSTGNLYSAAQPGGSVYGLERGDPVDPAVAYAGSARRYGTPRDPMVGRKPGGVIVFGGGLALYDGSNRIVGGVGLSGDMSCADHMIAWRVRHNLGLDNFGGVVGGVSGDPLRPDNIVYDIIPNPNGGTGASASGFGHPQCPNTGDQTALPPVS